MPNQTVKTYTVTDPVKLSERFAQFHIPGVDFTKPTGDVEVHGCKLGWQTAVNAVTITVLSKPFYVSYGQIWNALSELFAG